MVSAIVNKWPKEYVNLTILVQHDNARTNIYANDKEFCESVGKTGFDMRIKCQPPNSPNLNVLDLDFFRAIQSIKYKEASKTTERLTYGVEKSFETFSSKMSKRIFLTLHHA